MKPHEYNTEERLVAANEEVVECMEALNRLFYRELHSVDHDKAMELIKEIARHSERAGMLKAALAVQEAYKQNL